MRQIRIAVICAASFALLCLLMFAFAPETGAAGSAAPATSRDGIWQTIDRNSIAATDLHLPAGSSYRALRLNKGALAQQLARAPMEGSGDLRHSPVVLSLPMPDGSLQRFHVEESPIMEPSLAARLPGVKTYRGRGIDDATASTRFDLTPQGFHALVLSAQGSTYVEPASKGGTTSYVTHPSQLLPGEVFKCGVTEADEAEAVARGVKSRLPTLAGVTPKVTNGSTLRTYRLAVATTGEWFGIYGAGSVANAQAAITSIINLVDAIYERDVAIRFTLVNNTNIIFTNPATDPYSTNAADSTTLNENQSTLDNAAFLGSANYDVGHVFGGITGQPSGSSSFSGFASVGVTCSAGNKARGVSTMGNNPASPTAGIFIAGIAHEIGHEFSATHTFNATTGPICSAQRTGASAYEVGGGSTLMSYQTCGAENLQPQADQYFHVRSLEQIVNYATNSAPCATTGATGNDVPIVTGPGNFTIPANTPFQLTATASDANGSLTYSWEEYDLGNAGPPNTDDGSRPIFRGYSPVTIPTRIFPSLQYILNNANVPPTTYNGNCRDGNNTIPCLTGESLPSTSRTMNFQLVVRDNQANGGAINTATSVVTVTNTAGPFAVTFPNGGETLSSPQRIEWNVAGTNVAPVNTANVKISLSTDGGNTFPTVLTASAPNTGGVGLNLPDGIITSNARIKVEAVGNIFFDISDGNFTLVPSDNCPAVSSIAPNLGNVGTVVTITGVNFTGVNAVKFAGSVATNFTVNNDTQITATVPGGAMDGPLVLSKPGCDDLQAGTFSVCSNPPVELSVDNGNPFGFVSNAGSDAYYVNRLTPATYPATLTQVRIFFRSFDGPAVGAPITVVAGGNAGGTANIDNTAFQTFATTVLVQDAFNTYTLPNPITIAAGDFVVGFRIVQTGLNPAAHDNSAAQNRSYTSGNGVSFLPDANGNLMVRAAQVYTGCSSGAPVPLQAVSTALHGAISASRLIHASDAVSFNIPLPLTGDPGIECRTGGATGDHQVVVTFPSNVTVNGSPQARVTIGTGQIGSGGEPNEGVVTVSGAVVTIPLTNVPNAHKIGVTLFRVSDGTNSGSVTVPMGILLGDTTGNGAVNGSDVALTKSKSGQPVDATNFRSDVSVNNSINATDVSLVKSKSGTALP